MEKDLLFTLLLGLLLIFGLASTRVVKKIKLPNVTGFLIIGIIIASICIGIDYATDFKIGLAQELQKLDMSISGVALGFIALSIGEEFKISKMKKYGWKIGVITLFQSLMACLLVDGAVILTCYLLKLPIYIGIILGAIATATAPAATLMVINQYQAKGPLVDLLLPVVAFDDAVGLIIFAISVSISKSMAGNAPLDVMSFLVIPLINIFGSIGIGFVLGLFLRLTINFFKSRHNHLIMLISFTLLGVGLCALINGTCAINGEYLEFSNLLCCMTIGATYINLGKDKEITKRDFHLVDRWTPFLFLLFFVLSGSNLVISGQELFSQNNGIIVPTLIIFAVYLVCRSLGKYLGAYVGCKMTKQPKENTNYLGITLLPQAGVAIGMANVVSEIEVFKNGGIGNIIVTVVLCATLVYELLGPLGTKWALKKAGEIPNLEGEENYGDDGNVDTVSNATDAVENSQENTNECQKKDNIDDGK